MDQGMGELLLSWSIDLIVALFVPYSLFYLLILVLVVYLSQFYLQP